MKVGEPSIQQPESSKEKVAGSCDRCAKMVPSELMSVHKVKEFTFEFKFNV